MNCPICLNTVGIFFTRSTCNCKLKYHKSCYNKMKKFNNINCCWCRIKNTNKKNKFYSTLKFIFLPYFFSNNNYKRSYFLLLFDTMLMCELFKNIYDLLFQKIMKYQIVFIIILLSKNIIIDKYLQIYH